MKTASINMGDFSKDSRIDVYCSRCNKIHSVLLSEEECEDGAWTVVANRWKPVGSVESEKEKLCRQMLILGVFADGTKNMVAKDIKALLYPFFGKEFVEQVAKGLT